jgi:predicted transcriptional regulator
LPHLYLKYMNLEQAILSQSKKVDRALETLKANRKYQQDKLTHGLARVGRYVEDVEGDWLDNWTDEAGENEQEPKSSLLS